jgi:hypothetical protein
MQRQIRHGIREEERVDFAPGSRWLWIVVEIEMCVSCFYALIFKGNYYDENNLLPWHKAITRNENFKEERDRGSNICTI